MNRFNGKGWYLESQRHALAAKGIRTSFLKMMAPYPGWAVNVGRYRPVKPSKKQIVEDEIAWVRTALKGELPPPEGITEERRKELMIKLEELEKIREEMRPGRKGGSMLSEFQKEAKRRQIQHMLADERAQRRLLNRINNLILEAKDGNVGGDLITEEVLSGYGPGRSTNPLDFAAKRIFKKGKFHSTLSGPEVKALASEVEHELKPLSKKIEIAGSIRRGSKNEPIDVDIVMIPKDKKLVKGKLGDLGKVTRSGNDMVETKIRGVDVDVYFTEPKHYGGALLTYTGSFGHNIGLRQIARKQGKILNQRGVFDRGTGEYLAGRTERDIYSELERPRFKKPEERD